MQNRTILLTAGSTGGHLFPTLAIAQVLKDRGENIIFVTDKRGESILRFHNSQNLGNIISYSSQTPFQNSILKFFFACIILLWSCILEFIRFVRSRPSIVVGFGGYATFPSLLAALLCKCPIILHEQNRFLGKVQNFFLKRSKLIFISMPLIQKHKMLQIKIGLPIRNSIQLSALQSIKYNIPSSLDDFNLLILGGSQGAKSFSKILPKLIGNLPLFIKKKIYIYQQCCKGQEKDILSTYKKMGLINIKVSTFFKNIEKYYILAHLILARSGGSTLSEMMLYGKPGIFIPYPYSSDDHQLYNAKFLTLSGAGWMVEEKNLSTEYFSHLLESLILDSESLINTSSRISALSLKKTDQEFSDFIQRYKMCQEVIN